MSWKGEAALLVAFALFAGCGVNGVTAPQAGMRSGTGLFLSDIHFNPLADPTLAASLAQAPASQWDSIFRNSTISAKYSYSDTIPSFGTLIGDTNFPLLQSALGAMRRQDPSPDIVFVSGDLVAHGLPYFFGKSVPSNSQAQGQTAYAAFVDKTERYVAMKLSQAFPNAQIVPALGDWDTSCGSSDTYPGTEFLAAFSSDWNAAVNRYGGAPDFQSTFVANGGYYSTTLPIDPRGRLIVLETPAWTPGYNLSNQKSDACAPGGVNPAFGNGELAWLASQLDAARSLGQRVWILGHVPPGVPGGAPNGATGVEAAMTARKSALGASCPIVVPFYADAADAPIPDYSSQLYALLAGNRDLLTLGIFGHEHMDDFRVLQDSSGKTIFGMKLVPSITPFDGNNPAFVQFAYDANAGTITDATTWYLTNLSAATAAAAGPAGAWGLEYDFDATYGQTALDSNGVAGAVAKILVPQSSAQAAFRQYYPSSAAAAGFTTFLPYGCALDKLTAADYSACSCGR